MTDEIKAISVGLRVNLSQLDADLQSARLKAQNTASKQYKLNFSVGRIDLTAAEREIKRLLAGKIVVTPTINVSRASAREFRAAFQSELARQGPIPVQIKANLNSAEIKRIRAEIIAALGIIPINVTGGRGGGRGGVATPSTTTLTPHERAVNTDAAAKVARAVKSSPATPTVASSGSAAVVPSGRATRPAPVPVVTPEPVVPPRATTGQAAALPAPRKSPRVVAVAPSATAAPTPKTKRTDVRISPEDGLTHKYDAETGADLGPAGVKGRFAQIRKAQEREGANRRLSIDKNRGRAEEMDPNAPPYIVGLGSPLTAEEMAAKDARGRGVRGGRVRAGSTGISLERQLDIDTIQRQEDARISGERDAAVRAPARGSRANLGSYRGGAMHRRVVAQVQFNRFDPALGQAFEALQAGELGEARELLKGLSGRLAGQTPKERRRYFKLFKNTEKVKPELLEQHSALGALFHSINMEGAQMQLDRAEGALGAFAKPKGRKSDWPEAEQAEHNRLLATRALAQKSYTETLQGKPPSRQGKAPNANPSPAERAAAERNETVPEPLRARKSSLMPGAEGPEIYKPTPRTESGPSREIGEGWGGSFRPMSKRDAGVWESLLGDIEKARSAEYAAQGKNARGAITPEAKKLTELVEQREAILTKYRLPGRAGGGNVYADGFAARRAESLRARDRDRTFMGMTGDEFEDEVADAERWVAARHLRDPKIDKLRAMADQSVSPNEAAIAKRMLHEKGIRGYAGGGLMARIKAAEEAKKKGYLVNERHEEAFIGDSGMAEHIKGGPQIFVPPEDGKIVPFVPAWLRRNNAKDMTGRAGGGRVYEGKLSAEPGSGLVGTKQFRTGAEGERAAIAGGLLGKSGGVQRVFVVNWPSVGAGGITSAPRGGSIAAGPYVSDTAASKAFARSLGSELKKLLAATKPIKPEAPENEGPGSPIGLSPEEKVQARLDAINSESGAQLRRRVTQIKAGLSETQSQSPVRSLAPAVGQIVATRFGRGELLQRLAVAREQTAQLTKAESFHNTQVQKEAELTTKLAHAQEITDPKKREAAVAKATDELERQKKATEGSSKAVQDWATKAESAAKHADAFSLKLGTLLGNTGGIIGGTLLFGATLGIAQAAITGIGAAMSPLIERFLGFGTVAGETTKALGEQIRANQGATQTAFALTAAQAGLSKGASDVIEGAVSQRAQFEAGNDALKQQIDLLHTYQAVSRQNANAPGGERALSQYTGGFAGSGLFGTAGTGEQLQHELDTIPGASTATSKGKGGTPSGKRGASLPGQQQLELDLAAGTLKFFNAQLELGGARMKFVAQTALPELTDAVRAEAAEAFRAAGQPGLAQNVLDRKTVLLDSVTGKVVTSAAKVNEALSSLALAGVTPDPEVLIRQLTQRVIPAQLSQFGAEGRLQRQLIPGRAALSQLASPTPGLSGGPSFNAGLVGVEGKSAFNLKFDLDAAKAAKSYETLVGGAVSNVNAMIEQGKQDMVNLVPPQLRTEFSGVLADIEETGKAIASIQTGIQQQQSNLALAEYNNQLRIARRSLQDAKDLQAGIAGETRNTVGGLEGMNYMLQRQLQLLGFELQQRQINFRIATAGFVAPGTTPEERAARIEAAKIEASYAQKQLDLQKQIAANEYKSTTMPGGQVSRQVEDLQHQIGLLEQGRNVTINTAAASRALDILNKKQQLLVENAGTYIEEGTKIVTAALQAASQVQTATGKGFSYVLGETAKAWGIFGTQAQAMLNALRGTAPTNSGPVPVGGNTGKTALASGLMFDTNGPTDLTVGEAGKETVAVLRNPRQMSLNQLMTNTREYMPQQALGAGAGGGLHITVVITGNTISKDTDLHALAEEIVEAAARKAEERVMRKASLLNGRRV